jgi:hypothetical protein
MFEGKPAAEEALFYRLSKLPTDFLLILKGTGEPCRVVVCDGSEERVARGFVRIILEHREKAQAQGIAERNVQIAEQNLFLSQRNAAISERNTMIALGALIVGILSFLISTLISWRERKFSLKKSRR